MKNGPEHPDNPRLLEIIGAIADNQQVDWDTVESSTPEPQRALISKLRVISQVTSTHKEGQFYQSGPASAWGHLQIIEKIGEGAFGEVYRANDPYLDREVALKLYYPDRVQPTGETVKAIEEGRLLARIRHPNVVTVYGADQYSGRVGIWMELVEGQTLQEVIQAQGPIQPEEAMMIVREVCRALSALHEVGVIHRDIKASNIMRAEDGRIVLMDLGVSRDIDRQESGRPYGTPLYTAPELWLESESCFQSDIYSVGILLFHLITGEFPVAGHSLVDIRRAHANGKVKKLHDLRPDLPEPLLGIVDRALATDSDQRFSTAGQLAQALGHELGDEGNKVDKLGVRATRPRALQMILATSVMAVLAIFIWYTLQVDRDSRDGIFPEEKIMLAVLPFENLGDPEDDYFADGISEEIRTKLATMPELGVIARESAFKFRGEKYSVEEIGRQLGVEYILRGAIHRQRVPDGSGLIRMTSRLITAADNRNVWARTYEEPLDELFTVQASIGEMVASTMNITLKESSQQAMNEIPTRNLEAYDYYVRAKEMWANTTSPAQEYPIIEKLFLRALELDPEFAQPYALLGLVHGETYYFNIDRTPQRLEMLKSAYEKALDLNPAIPEAYVAKSLYLNITQADSEVYEAAFEKACSLRPNDWIILFYRGIDHKNRGLFEEAIHSLRQAQVLDPASPTALVEEAICYQHLRRYEETARVCEHIISLWPDHGFPYSYLANMHVTRDGNTEMAKQVLQSASGLVEKWRLIGDWQWIHFLEREYEKALEVTSEYSDEYLDGVIKYLTQASLFYYLGRHDEMKARADSARTILEEKVQEQPDDYFWHLHLGRAYALLNRKEGALREIRIASEIMPVTRNAVVGATVLYSCAATYSFVGEHDIALEQLEYLLDAPTSTTEALLRIDPTWDPPRDHPRFQELVN